MKKSNNNEDIKNKRNEINICFDDEHKDISLKKVNKNFCIKKEKRRFISLHDKFIKNPNITKFTYSSKFIYDIDEGEKYINLVANANRLKLNNDKLSLYALNIF